MREQGKYGWVGRVSVKSFQSHGVVPLGSSRCVDVRVNLPGHWCNVHRDFAAVPDGFERTSLVESPRDAGRARTGRQLRFGKTNMGVAGERSCRYLWERLVVN